MTLTKEEAKEIGKIRREAKNMLSEEEKDLHMAKQMEAEDLRIAKNLVSSVREKTMRKTQVTNFPDTQKIEGKTDTKIKNWPDIFKVAGEVVAKVAFPAVQKITGAVTAKIENFPTVQKIVGKVTANVDNFPEVQRVEITNPTEKMYVVGETAVSNLPLGKANRSGDPERYLGVRLTDGNKYYSLKEFLVAAGGMPSAKIRTFIDSLGQESQALVDKDHHLQVDVLSGAGGGTVKTDGEAIAGADTASIVAGKDGSGDAQFVTTDTSGHLQVDVLSGGGGGTLIKDGAAVDADYTGQMILGTDGSNYQAIKVDSGGAVQVDIESMPTATVTATDFDIRDLTSVSDSVEVIQDTASDLKATVTQAGNVNIGDISKGTQTNDVKVTLDSEDVTVSGTVTMGAGSLEIGKVKLTDGVETAGVNASNQLEVAVGNTVTVDLGANNDVTMASLPDTAAGDLAAINSAITGSLDVSGATVTVSATDLDVRDLAESSDAVAVYGSDDGGSTMRIVETDSGGAVAIQDGGNTITVDGSVNATLQASDGTDIGDVDVASHPSDTFVAEGGALGKGVLVQGDDGTDRHNLQVTTSGYLSVQEHNRLIFECNDNQSTAQTNTQLEAAPGASLSFYITDISMSTDTAMNIKLVEDTSGSATTRAGPYYFAANGGIVANFKSPLRISTNKDVGYTSSEAGNHTVEIHGYIAA